MPKLTAEVMAGWTVDDKYKVDIGQEAGPAHGVLKNPSFPDKVGSNEDWTGTIDLLNNGDSSGTFRFRVDSKTTDSFTLDPGQSVRLKLSGTGPAEFTIYAERST